MKKYTIFLAICCLPHLFFAQGIFEYVPFEPHATYHDVAIKEGLTVAVGKQESCMMPLMTLFDAQGDSLWSVTPYDCGFCYLHEVAFESDGRILASGNFRQADDVGSPEDGYAIVRVDTAGQVLGFRQFIFQNGFDNPVRFSTLANGNIALSTGRRLLILDSNLDSLATLDFETLSDYPVIDQQLVLDENTILLNIGAKGYLVDVQGVLLDSLDLEDAPTSNFLLDPSEDFVHYSTASGFKLLHIASGNVNAESGAEFKGITMDDAQLVAFDDRNIYRRTGIGVWDSVWTSGPELEIQNLKWKAERFVYTLEGPAESALNFTYPRTVLGSRQDLSVPPAFMETDVLIGAIELDSLNLNNTIVDHPLTYFSVEHFFSVEVVNAGQDTLQEVVIATPRLNGFNCGELRIIKSLHGLNLPPGGSYKASVQLNNTYGSNSPFEFDIAYNICFFALGPNHQQDGFFGNNQSCQQVQIVNTENRSGPSLDFTIAPNPASHVLNLQWKEGDLNDRVQLHLISAQGQQVLQQLTDSTENAEINVSGLPAGVYWLIVQSEGFRTVKKVIIQ